jgi:hypothetical protein
MTTVFCWGARWAGFAADGSGWEGVERLALLACDHETGHWHKMPRERIADKQGADFTECASQGNIETWGQPRF